MLQQRVSPTLPLTPSLLFQQVTYEGNFSWEHKEDDWLKLLVTSAPG